MRLDHLLDFRDGDGLNDRQYQRMRNKIPLVIKVENGVPHFRGKPETRDQAIQWLRNRQLIRNHERTHYNELEHKPKPLVLNQLGGKNVDIESWLMDEFSIDPDEI